MMSSQVILDLPIIRSGSSYDKPIELKRLNVKVFVLENIATTTFEMQFYNDNDRVMEGELNFPLANGVTVSRYALDVNGEMREGVVVEKEKATQAFEAVTRRNIDPGIVEVTKGNNFKTRVYPIPPKGYKKALIAFEQELSGDDKNYIYHLPLGLKHVLEEFSVKVEVVMNQPKATKGKHPSINLNFTEERNAYISEYKQSDIKLDTHLAFAIPRPKKVSEVHSYKGTVTSDNYFYINLPVKSEKRSKDRPSHLTLIWDESASGEHRNLERELAILKDYLQWMGKGKVDLITFSNTIHHTEHFRVEKGECTDLMSFVKHLKYDGATNIGAIDFKGIQSDEILLFSDGISNFGEKKDHQFASPIIAINSSNIADHNLLTFFASSSNGVYVNAFHLSDEEVSDRLYHEQKRLIKAEYNSDNISELYPKAGYAIGAEYSCAGKAEGALNDVTLHFGFGQTITESHTVTVDNTARSKNNVGERIWAQKKLKELLGRGEDEQVKAHGKKHSLVTPGTSFIVLDDVQDYVRYEILPPPSLQEAYHHAIAQRSKDRDQSRQRRLEEICRQFEADVKWWESVGDFRNKEIVKPAEEMPSPSVELSDELSIQDDEVSFSELAVEEEAVEETVVRRSAMSRSVSQRKSVKKEGSMPSYSSSISIKEWDSNAAYINELKATDAEGLYSKYLTLKAENANNPSFYFDVASYLFQKSQKAQALRVISNLAELELENAELLRTLGRKLSEYEFYDEALAVFAEVMRIRSFEPHSYIDMGLTYAEKGEYQKALGYLYAVIDKSWDSDISARFPGLEVIILHDINNLIHKHRNELDISAVQTCFVKNMPVDIRVVIDWDANDTDVDLWVTDPHGERCSYQNKATKIGGRISNDVTQGYGPEEFRLKHAVEGKYVIDVNFFGTRKQTVAGNVTVRAFVYTNYGSDKEHKEVITLQLEPKKSGDYTVGEMVFMK